MVYNILVFEGAAVSPPLKTSNSVTTLHISIALQYATFACGYWVSEKNCIEVQLVTLQIASAEMFSNTDV